MEKPKDGEKEVTELDKLFQELKQKNEEKIHISKRLGETSAKLRELRAKRSELISVARANKAERDKIKENVKTLVGQLQEKKQKRERNGNFENPGELKSRINKIEWKIQTDVIPYNKEKELTKIRKELEAQLETAIKKSDANKEVQVTRSEIANRIFEEQLKHENVVKFSSESEKVRQEMTELSKKLSEEKEKMDKIRSDIDAIKSNISKIKGSLNEKASKMEETQANKAKKDLNDKLKEIKEKFSKSKKLTTEDIIALQNNLDEISF
jgi:uncharacterized coiled-coil DUF342 family protein